MQSIPSLSDRELLEKTENLAAEERRVTSLLIEHLREVNRRKLFSDLGLPSLHRYCQKVLKMSEGSAQRRINALRLTEAFPEIREKLENGDVSLSVVSQLQTFFRQEEKITEVPDEKKQAMIQSVQGLSSRDAERELLKHSVEPVRHAPERTHAVSSTTIQIQLTATDEQMALFERVRGLLAHAHPHLTWIELFEKMARIAEQKLDPTLKKCRSASPTSNRNSRLPTSSLRRDVLRRDGKKCTQCGSSFALEIDHRTSWARGGQTQLENLRTLCRNCNQRSAIREFGLRKVEKEIQR